MKNPFRGRKAATSLPMPTAPMPETKGAAPILALQLTSSAQWTPREFGAMSREGYARNPIAYRCVRMISEAAASVALCARRDGQCVPDDPVGRLLVRGHSQQSITEVMEAFYGYLQVSGDSYFEAVLSSDVPIMLRALRPDRMSLVTDKAGRVQGWDHNLGGVARRFRRDAATDRCAVHHMRLFNPSDDCFGLPPLQAAAQAVDLHNQGGEWAKALLDNSARPSGALIYKGQPGEHLTDEQFERLKSELEGNYSGPQHAGRPMVLEGGLDWKSMSMSPSDMDFTQTRREAARDIALAFGVPPMLLGIPGDNSYANYREANQAFWRQTIIPLVQKTARGLEGWLQPFFGDDLTIHAELEHVPAMAEERAVLWKRLSEATFITDDERRILAGLASQEAEFDE
ncbi:phage portal protein [Litorimonas sp. RW-G-Af-16]|uniref:phage portal protein n=1 Tax=Litorimonas sp. RW-G-Af-16 TaxID=3241168 RepID=UPI00390C423F